MLLSGKSLKHDFIRFASATMASQVVFSLYSMVDGLMVSIGVNEYAMSAVNLAIPFTNALFSIAVALRRRLVDAHRHFHRAGEAARGPTPSFLRILPRY